MTGPLEVESAHRARKRRVRTPILIQMQATECGAAALGIVLAYYGLHVSLEELRRRCGVGSSGTSGKKILEAARAYGMTATGRWCDIAALASQRLPAILYWNFEHFVVLEGMGRRHVWVNDPSVGHRPIMWEEFERGYTGVLLHVEPGPDFQRGGRPFRAWPALRSRARGLSAALLPVGTLGLLISLTTLAGTMLSRVFVDQYLQDPARSTLRSLQLVTAVIAVLLFSAGAAQQLLAARVEHATALHGAARVMKRMLRLPIAFFHQRLSADLASRVRSNETIAEVLVGRFTSLAVDAALLGVYAALLCAYDLVIGLCCVVFGSLNLLALRSSSALRRSASASLQTERTRLASTVQTAISMIETIKAGGQEELLYQQFAVRQLAVTAGQQRVGAQVAYISGIPILLTAANGIVLTLLGSYLVGVGTLSIGSLVALQGLAAAMNRPVAGLHLADQSIQECVTDLRRLEDVERFADENAGKSPASTPTCTAREVKGHLRLENVSFAFDPDAGPAVDGVSLDLPPGSRIALVGASGSGKSTIARLAAGLYIPSKGRITLDGRDIRDCRPEQIAAAIGVVDQHSIIFAGTLRENVTLWDTSIDDDAVLRALSDACFPDADAASRNLLDARVSERGRNLSGGQRQRLEIAHSLARDPQIVILDEATSQIDSIAEQRIYENLRRRRITCLIVAHRMSTVSNCDEIVVVDHGSISERGSHDQLVQQNGKYCGLIRIPGDR